MESSQIYSNAMAELLHYLKGIKQDDVNKIPKKLMKYFKSNASSEYQCNFDYTRPLNELNLLDETKGLIAVLCLNYWCETEEQKMIFMNRLNENEQKYQEKLQEKYNPNNLFKKATNNVNDNVEKNVKKETTLIVVKKNGFFSRLMNRIKSIIL